MDDDRRMQAAKEESTTPSRNSSGGSLTSWLFKLLGRGSAGPCNGILVRGGVRHLQELHTLGAVNINTADGMGILDEICNLRQLKKLELSGIDRKNSKFLSKSILNQKNWESLTLQLDKENHVDCWDDISPPSSIRSLKLYGHVEQLSALRFKTLRNLRKLSLEMTRLLTREDVDLLGCVDSLLTLRLRINNGPDVELQFPAHRRPVNSNQADGNHQAATAPPPPRRQAPNNPDGNQQVPGRLFSKLQVLEIASKSKLYVRFYEGAMEKLEVLKAHCWVNSPLHLHGLKHANSLNQVYLLGSYDDTLKVRLQQKLARHPKKPALKLQPKTQPPPSQTSRQ